MNKEDNKIMNELQKTGYIKIMLDTKTVSYKKFKSKIEKNNKIWVQPLVKHYYDNKLLCMSVMVGITKEEYIKDD